jgi:hypothetical protein
LVGTAETEAVAEMDAEVEGTVVAVADRVSPDRVGVGAAVPEGEPLTDAVPVAAWLATVVLVSNCITRSAPYLTPIR